MKALWKLTCRLTGQKSLEAREKCFLLLNCTGSGMVGLVTWLIVRIFALHTPDWMVCFIGYPVMFHGFFGGLMYLMHIED